MSVEDSIDLSFKRLKDAINGGKINAPEDFAIHAPLYTENEKIIPPDSPEGRHFQSYMAELTKKLRPSLANQHFHFLITDKKQKNAYIFETKPPIITFDKSLLTDFKTEDELAYVLGHELSHFSLAKELGEGKNSKGEEYICDIRPLAWMHAAGYDARKAIDVTQRFATESKKSDFAVIDVHGLPQHRVDVVEKALAGLDKHVGGLHHSARAVPAQMSADITTAKHVTFIDAERNRQKYDTLTPVEKVQFIGSIVDKMPEHHIVRHREAREMLFDIPLNKNEPTHVDALGRLAEQVSSHTYAFNALSKMIAKKMGRSNLPPLNRYNILSSHMQSFIDASTLEDAQDHAEKILQEYSQLDLNGIELQGIRLPSFRLPSQKSIIARTALGEVLDPPWETLAKLAVRNKNASIAQALALMGAPDKRAYDLLPEQFLAKFAGDIKPLSLPIFEGEGSKSPTFGPQGEIHALGPYSIPMQITILTNEAKQAKQRAKKLEATPALPQAARVEKGTLTFTNVSPEEFVKNYETYFDQNKDLLKIREAEFDPNSSGSLLSKNRESEIKVQTEQQKAVEASSRVMIGMFNKLLKADPQKYRSFVREFYLGRSDKRDFAALESRTSPELTDSFYRFAFIDQHKIFSPEEKGKILREVTYTTELHNEKIARELWRIGIGYKEPQTMRELEDVLQKHQAVLKGAYLEDGGFSNTICELGGGEILRFMQKQQPGTCNIATLLKDHGDFVSAAEQRSTSDLSDVIIKHIKHQKKWPEDAASRVAIYKTLEQNRLFPNDDWRNNFVEKLVDSIKATAKDKERVALLEDLLLGEPIKDVPLRKAAVRQWVEANASYFGKDKGTANYHKQHDAVFTAMVDRVKAKSNIQLRHEMFSQLADKLETQREWSYQLRDNLMEHSRDALVKSHVSGIVIEGLLDAVSSSETARHGTIEFLIAPLTSGSVEKFTKVFDEIRDQSSRSVPKRLRRIEGRRFHENFWNAPMPVRVMLLDEMLISADQRQDDRAGKTDHYKQSMQYVFDQILPTDMKYSREARLFLESYSNVIPHYQRSLLLSSMMVASERIAYDGSQASIGARLAMVLEMMGPAERKVGQAVHSHPQTPADIRDDMGRLKSMAAVPARWDIFSRYENVVPEEHQKGIARIGALKGAASYFVTVGANKIDGSHSVIALQRANAQAQAKEGFRLLHDLIQDLRVRDEKLGSVADTLVEMVQQAEKMSSVETNSDLGAEQVKLAQGLYNGTKIKVGESEFTIETAPWIAYGAEFREQKEMKGVHFDKLPEKTPEDLQYKHDVAKAYLTLELGNMLKGGVFDHDRHGAQLRIDRKTNHLGLFDHGAMELVPPTKEEKQLLARILVRGIVAYQKNTAGNSATSTEQLAKALYNVVEEVRAKEGKAPDYLVRTERGLLALQDFFRYVGPDDIKDILTGIYKAGKIDPVIQGTLMQMVFSGQLNIANFMGVNPNAQPVTISQEAAATPPPPKRYDTQIKLHIPGQDEGSKDGAEKTDSPDKPSGWADTELRAKKKAPPSSFRAGAKRDPGSWARENA